VLLTEYQLVGDHLAPLATQEVVLESLDNRYPPFVGLTFNHVLDANKRSKNSNEISNPTDRHILRLIRSKSDLVITTGKTARFEQLKASNFAPMLIVTRSNLLDVPATKATSQQRVFVTNKQSDFNNPNAVAIGFIEGDIATWIGNFLESYPKAVLESGPSLAQELSSLIGRACITVVDAEDVREAYSLAKEFIADFGKKFLVEQMLEIDGNYFFIFIAK